MAGGCRAGEASRDGDGDEKGGGACGRDACGGIGGGTWVHAIILVCTMLKDSQPSDSIDQPMP